MKRLFFISISIILNCFIFSQTLDWAVNYPTAGAVSLPETAIDSGEDIVIDADKNVYIVGYYSGDIDGDPGAGTDNMAKFGSDDIFISKLDIDGNYLWTKRIGGANADGAYSLALDPSGNILVAGYYRNVVDFDPGASVANLTSVISSGTTYSSDIFILKLDNDGNYLWAKSIGGSTSDHAMSVTTDASSNVYICGSFGLQSTGSVTVDFDPGAGTANLTTAGSGGFYDAFLLKLNSSGNFVWVNKIGAGNDDRAREVVVDASNNVYVAGSFRATVDFDPSAATASIASTAKEDAFVAKYDANGNYLWAKKMGGTETDESWGLDVASDGGVYVSGVYYAAATFGGTTLSYVADSDGFLCKLDASGNFQWARSIANTGFDYMYAVDAAEDGFIYLTGYTGSTSNLYFSQYDPSGTQITAFSIGAAASSDQSKSIVADELGCIYSTGYFRSTADFDPSGATFNVTATNASDTYVLKICLPIVLPVELTDFDLNCDNSQIDLSWSTLSERNNDYFDIEISNDGIFWNRIAIVEGNGNSSQKIDYEFSIVQSNAKYIRLSQVDYNGQKSNYVTNVINCESEIDVVLYPNPANESISIKSNSIIKTVDIYDLNGKLISTLTPNKKLDNFIINTLDFSNGFYIVNVNTVLEVFSKKVSIEH